MTPPTRRGLVGVLLLVTSTAGLIAASYPPYATADESHHVDYAWRVWHGELPEFDDGLTAPLGEARSSAIHYAWQHPPAYYLLEAPLVGPLLDAGHWRAAVLLGRALPMALAAGTVLAVGFATRRAFPGAEPALVLGAMALAAVANPLHLASGWVYNDLLAAVAVVVTLGLAAQVVRDGPGRREVLLLAAVCTLGLASRASFVTTLAVAVLAVVWGGWSSPRPRRARRIGLGLGVVVGIPLLTSGWFYARNRRLTGDWTGSQPDRWVELLGRVSRPTLEVATDLDVWRRSSSGLVPVVADVALAPRSAEVVAVAIVAVLTLAALVRLVVSRWPAVLATVDRGVAAPVVLLVLAVGGVAAQVVQHVANGGGANARYLLPVLLPVSLFWAYGLLGPRRARGQLLSAFLVLGTVLLALQHGRTLERRVAGEVGAWSAAAVGIEENGLPWVLLPLAVAGVAVALVLVASSLWAATAGPDAEADA